MTSPASEPATKQHSAPKAIIFDLLTALLDSWTLWNAAAAHALALKAPINNITKFAQDSDTNSDPVVIGRRWRLRYLTLTYNNAPYVPYESLVAAAAADVGLPPAAPSYLLEHWDELLPWPGVQDVLGRLRDATIRSNEGDADGARRIPKYKLGIITNCSAALGQRAASLCFPPTQSSNWDAVLTAEQVGYYKPRRECYRAILSALNVSADEAVFVAGSASDVPGAQAVGMRVFWHNAVGLESLGLAEQEDRDFVTLMRELLGS